MTEQLAISISLYVNRIYLFAFHRMPLATGSASIHDQGC